MEQEVQGPVTEDLVGNTHPIWCLCIPRDGPLVHAASFFAIILALDTGGRSVNVRKRLGRSGPCELQITDGNGRCLASSVCDGGQFAKRRVGDVLKIERP